MKPEVEDEESQKLFPRLRLERSSHEGGVTQAPLP
jgi:hypothetical protein